MPHLPMKRYVFNEIPACSMISAQFISRNAMSATIQFKIEGRTDFFSAVVRLA